MKIDRVLRLAVVVLAWGIASSSVAIAVWLAVAAAQSVACGVFGWACPQYAPPALLP
jgi:hypothetical protein